MINAGIEKSNREIASIRAAAAAGAVGRSEANSLPKYHAANCSNANALT